MNNISEDQSLIQLETLEKQYGTVLSQYEEAYNTYINFVSILNGDIMNFINCNPTLSSNYYLNIYNK